MRQRLHTVKLLPLASCLLPTPIQRLFHQALIILSEDDKEIHNKNIDTDETPTEKIIEGIYQCLHEAITGKTIPLEQMWEGIDEE